MRKPRGEGAWKWRPGREAQWIAETESLDGGSGVVLQETVKGRERKGAKLACD